MSKPKRPLKPFDVLPGHVLRDEYGFNAANRPEIIALPEEVPEHLHALIPLVKKWAIPCDVTRHDVFEVEGEDAVASLYHEAIDFVAPINEWLDSLPEDVDQWSESAISFMYFLKAHGEAYQPTPEELAERERRFAEHAVQLKRKKDIEAGKQAFQDKDYTKCYECLKEHVNHLDGSLLSKYKFSAKKAAREGNTMGAAGDGES